MEYISNVGAALMIAVGYGSCYGAVLKFTPKKYIDAAMLGFLFLTGLVIFIVGKVF